MNANQYYTSAWDLNVYVVQKGFRTNAGNAYADFIRNLPRPGSGGTKHAAGLSDLTANLEAGDYAVLLTDSGSISTSGLAAASELKAKVETLFLVGVNLPDADTIDADDDVIMAASPGQYYGTNDFEQAAILAAIRDATAGACPLQCANFAAVVSPAACPGGAATLPVCSGPPSAAQLCLTPYLSGAIDEATLAISTVAGAPLTAFTSGQPPVDAIATASFKRTDSRGQEQTFQQQCTGSVAFTLADTDGDGTPDCAGATILSILCRRRRAALH